MRFTKWALAALLFLFVIAVDVPAHCVSGPQFPKSNLLLAEGKLIILDEDGNLALATATPTELKVISKVSVMKNLAWTAPQRAHV